MKAVMIHMTVLAVLIGVGGAQAQPDSLWSRTFGGEGYDQCYSLIQTADGGYVMAGVTGSFGAGGTDFFLIKTDSIGDSLWSRTFGGENSESCQSLIQTADGGFALAGYTTSFGAGQYDFWLVQTDENGDSLWSRTFGTGGNQQCQSLIQTVDGGFALAGYKAYGGYGQTNFWLVRTDENGDSLWSRTFDQRYWDKCNSLIQTADGGFAMGGYTKSYGNSYRYFWLVRTNENGNLLWSRTFGGRGNNEIKCIIQTADGGFALAGWTDSFGEGEGDYWLLRTNEDGDSLWSRTVRLQNISDIILI